MVELEWLLQRLFDVGAEVDAVGFADALWLADAIDRQAGHGAEELPREAVGQPGKREAAEDPAADTTAACGGGMDEPAPAAGTGDLYDNVGGAGLQRASRVYVERGPSLPRQLNVARSLRPLKHQFPRGRRRTLDVESTIHAYVRSGDVVPVFSAVPERWFHLDVVLDDSPSMEVWREPFDELIRMLQQLGAFQTVHTWRLDVSQDDPVLRDPTGHVVTSGRLRDPAARRLVLVCSDCVARGWDRTGIWQDLRNWAASTATVLLNPLPDRLWQHTGLNAQAARLRPGRRGAHGGDLSFSAPLFSWLHPGRDDDAGWTALPTTDLSPDSLGQWSGTLMGTERGGCGGVLLPSPSSLTARTGSGSGAEDAEPQVDEPWDDEDDEDDGLGPAHPEDTVRAFRMLASPEARRLAVLCSGQRTLSLPVMRLIQHTMLPDAEVSDLAEVVVSGLFEEPPPRTGDSELLLTFRPGVREVLHRSLAREDAWKVHWALSRFIEKETGQPTFLAALVDPSGPLALPADLQPFAAAHRDGLRLLRGVPAGTESGASERAPSVGAREARRFLIAVTLTDAQEFTASRRMVVELFAGLGYQDATTSAEDLTPEELAQQIHAFCQSADRRPGDLLTVYVAAHAVSLAERVHRFLGGMGVRHLLLLVDRCGADAPGAGAAFSPPSRSDTAGAGAEAAVSVLECVSSGHADAGNLPRLLRVAVDELATEEDHPCLPLHAIARRMTELAGPGSGPRIHLSRLGPPDEPAFLPSPRHLPAPSPVDSSAPQTARAAGTGHAARREARLNSHFLAGAQASLTAGGGWSFTARHQALTEISAWLNEPRPHPPALVVCGDPGSGKSTVLGAIAALTSPQLRSRVPLSTLELPSRAIPPLGSVDVALSARELTDRHVVAELAAAAELSTDHPRELLAGLEGSPRPLTAVIDGLDEAATPDTLIASVLRPLMDHGRGRIRLLLGTRRSLLPQLGDSDGAFTMLDLDTERFSDPADLTAYTVLMLLESSPHSPYREAPPPVVREVAEAVTAVGGSFLTARIVARALAAADAVPDPRDPAWRASLPRDIGLTLLRELDSELGTAAEPARDLLRPLAFCQGPGLPSAGLWAQVASRMSRRRYTDEDVAWLRRLAGICVVEGHEDGRAGYRLCHQSLADALREDCDDVAAHTAITEVLLSHLPRAADGTHDWSRAEPYVSRYLSVHAAAAGRLNDPGELGTALRHLSRPAKTPRSGRATSPGAQVVVLHGMGRADEDRAAGRSRLTAALRDAVDRAVRDDPDVRARAGELRWEVSFPGYQDLFRAAGAPEALTGPRLSARDVAPGLETDLLLQWWETAARADLAVPRPDTRTLQDAAQSLFDPSRTSAIKRVVSALGRSRFFMGVAEHMLVGNIKQLLRYFQEEGLRESVINRVAEAISPRTRVLVGHSLGSIVAYEALCAHPEWPVRTLVTTGSPLGVRHLFFDRLKPAPVNGVGAWPGSVVRWVNVCDPRDLVALEPRLATTFGARVEDVSVSNGTAAHDMSRYLSAGAVGAAIVSELL
ncbi:SAV_2336 N-terminal domain-related protein [Streptomyces sp. 7N604]|uniref:SAV_2336 N-terminal domain-related protein n=1 Tax=Streptomyces sp. 7N604 TaxID=3457415 RepID=UPI003FD02BEF